MNLDELRVLLGDIREGESRRKELEREVVLKENKRKRREKKEGSHYV